MQDIPAMMYAPLVKLLVRHEDDKKRAYLDIYGNITAGIGHNLSAHDIADDIRSRWCREDATEFYNNLLTFPWFSKCNLARQIALIDMCFMGFKKFCGFQQMIAALAENNYQLAAKELLNSDYAKEVPTRAAELANILITGGLDV